MRRHPERAGFTLLEVLVAIAILAIIALASYRLLAGTVSTRDRGLAHEQKLQALQKAQMLIQRDVLQVAERPVRDEFGDLKPALYLPQENVLEFTRRGWRNPLQAARSDMVRVRYRVAAGQLLRERWATLDRPRASQPESLVLLEDVEDFQVAVFAGGVWHKDWPLLTQSQQEIGTIPLPKAVEIRFSLEPWGDIRRVIPLPESENRDDRRTTP